MSGGLHNAARVIPRSGLFLGWGRHRRPLLGAGFESLPRGRVGTWTAVLPSENVARRLRPGTLSEAVNRAAALAIASGDVVELSRFVGLAGDLPVVQLVADVVPVRVAPHKSVNLASPTGTAARQFDGLVTWAVKQFEEVIGPAMTKAERDAKRVLARALEGEFKGNAERFAKELTAGLELPEGVADRVGVTFTKTGKTMSEAGRKRAKRAYDLEIATAFKQPDTDALGAMADGFADWSVNWHKGLSASEAARVQGIVESGLADGLSPEVIGKELTTAAGQTGRAVTNYWTTTAYAWMGRSRSMGLLYSFRDAAIETFVVDAVLDEDTTEQCRYLHGKVVQVGATISSMESANDTLGDGDVEGFKAANPFLRMDGNTIVTDPGPGGTPQAVATVRQPGFGTADSVGRYTPQMAPGKFPEAGIGPPPYHHRCRSTIVPNIEGVSVPVKPVPAGGA